MQRYQWILKHDTLNCLDGKSSPFTQTLSRVHSQSCRGSSRPTCQELIFTYGSRHSKTKRKMDLGPVVLLSNTCLQCTSVFAYSTKNCCSILTVTLWVTALFFYLTFDNSLGLCCKTTHWSLKWLRNEWVYCIFGVSSTHYTYGCVYNFLSGPD